MTAWARPARRLGAASVAVAMASVALAPGQAAAATPGHRVVDDRRVVQAVRPGSSPGSGGLDVHRSHAEQVSATNTALAHASCDGCRAVALSFQVVIADRHPRTVSATNVAVAMTENCASCESLALAYQFVVATDGRAHLSQRGQRRLASVRDRLRALSHSERPLAEVHARTSALMAVVTEVVVEELRTRPQVHRKEGWERRNARPR